MCYQLDPAHDGANWFVYCGNYPMKYVDKTGLIISVAYNPNQAKEQFDAKMAQFAGMINLYSVQQYEFTEKDGQFTLSAINGC